MMRLLHSSMLARTQVAPLPYSMGSITQRSLEPSFEASAITPASSEDGNNLDT